MPTAKRGQATVEIAAPSARVYDLIADITNMGKWSPECYHCEWVGEVREAVVGERFIGHNRMGPIRWTTTCEIVTAEQGREFAFTVMLDKDNRESTRWRYRLKTAGAGTELTESFEFVWCPLASRIGELFLPRGRVMRRAEGCTRRSRASRLWPSPRLRPRPTPTSRTHSEPELHRSSVCPTEPQPLDAL